MNKNLNQGAFSSRKLLLALFGLLTLITSAEALPFSFQYGDLGLGFRKTGSYVGSYEIVVDVGPATNYVNLSVGTTINITQYLASQVDPDSYANWTNLQWSVTGAVLSGSTFPGYPNRTYWVTSPRVNGVSDEPVRASASGQQPAVSEIWSILNGAVSISSQIASNKDNTTTCVQEPYSIADGENYGVWIEDPTYPSRADLGGLGPLDANGGTVYVEVSTVAPFTSPVQCDLYEMRPSGTTDPHTGLTSGAGYKVGYFQFNINGTMTFTRASTTVAAPVAAFTASPTHGVAPLAVVFTNTSTGSFTNSLWSFGDGVLVTNTSSASVSHTYTNAGSYTVSLTVAGAGGSDTLTQTAYIVVSSASTSVPKFSGLTVAGGNLVISGTNGTASAQYRVLTSTNLTTALTNWVAVATNVFSSTGSFSYTNSTRNAIGYFRLVSP